MPLADREDIAVIDGKSSLCMSIPCRTIITTRSNLRGGFMLAWNRKQISPASQKKLNPDTSASHNLMKSSMAITTPHRLLHTHLTEPTNLSVELQTCLCRPSARIVLSLCGPIQSRTSTSTSHMENSTQ